MTADEFVKIVRGCSDKLRVDNIILTFSEQEFHGSGTMCIEQKKIKLFVRLNEGEKFPELILAGIHTEKDAWQLRGVIEYDLEFQCDRAMIASPAGSFYRWFDLNPVYLTPSGLDAMRSRERDAFLTQGESEKQPQVEEGHSVRFAALLQEYPFYEPLCGKTWEGEIDGFDFKLFKENRESSDLRVTMVSKQGYVSADRAKDEQRFQAFLFALAFMVGANAWPYRTEHWRGGKKVSDTIRATGKLARISHTPFSPFLAQQKIFGESDWNFQDILKKGTIFFEANSPLSKEISSILYLFRQADAEAVHPYITMIAVCALFENVVQIIFQEYELEQKARDERGVFKDEALQSFENAKEQLKTETSPRVWKLARELFKEENLSEQEPQMGDGSELFIKAKNKADGQIDKRIADECEGWHRMFKRIADTEMFSMRKKFQAVVNQSKFDQHWQGEMNRAFSTWQKARNDNFHLKEWSTLTENERKEDLIDQSQIAAAINVLILKLIGYSGPMRANTLWQNYQQG